MKATVHIQPPRMPNYLHATGLSPDGAMVPVEALSDAEVETFIAEWAVQFRAHVAERRKAAQEAANG
jgi:hypothetical protein